MPPSTPKPPAPKKCEGLTCTERGIFWRNSLSQEFNLAHEARVTPGEAAIKMKRSTEWVLRRIRDGALYPVVYLNPRCVEIYACGITDYYTRHTQGAIAS